MQFICNACFCRALSWAQQRESVLNRTWSETARLFFLVKCGLVFFPFYHCCYSFFIWHVLKAALFFLLIPFSPVSCPFWCRRGAASLRLVCCCALVCSYSFVYGAMPQKCWIAALVSPVIILLFAFVFVFVGSLSAVLPYQKKKRKQNTVFSSLFMQAYESHSLAIIVILLMCCCRTTLPQ